MNFKYTSMAKIIFIFIILTLTAIVILGFFWLSLTWALILLFWLLIFTLYTALMKKGIDPLSEKDFQKLSEFLGKQEVAEYLKELIFERSMRDLRKISIEIDLKFNTNLTQKKGWDMGVIRDGRLTKKLVGLDNKVRYGKKKLSD